MKYRSDFQKKCLLRSIGALIAVCFMASPAYARDKLEDSLFFDYQVFFTNPVCQQYNYNEPVPANDGTLLYGKPKNAYCHPKYDLAANIERLNSPHFQLAQLFRDNDVKELFLTFFSFSNELLAQELCSAIERNVAVTFIIDSNAQSDESARKQLDYLASCVPRVSDRGGEKNLPVTLYRGNQGGIGFGHNKFIMASFHSEPRKVKIIFGSGNLSSGTVLHHENWSFVTTNKQTYFAQSHACMRAGLINHADSLAEYKDFISRCRREIEKEPESDVQTFIVPGDGSEAMGLLTENMRKTQKIEGAAHRFTHPALIKALQTASSEGSKTVKLIVDDDIYWAGLRGTQIGSNTPDEARNVNKVIDTGVDVRYVETNQNQHLLSHNKFFLLSFNTQEGGVFTGAGNFTKAAFTNNFENYYYVTIPRVVEAFRQQYQHMFDQLATPYEKLPSEYANP